jgi:hypothetical protein
MSFGISSRPRSRAVSRGVSEISRRVDFSPRVNQCRNLVYIPARRGDMKRALAEEANLVYTLK